MKSIILALALTLGASTTFAGKLTVDKAMTCFVKSLEPGAFNEAWTNGGQKEFMRKVKSNENMPVLGDELANLVSNYMADRAFVSDFQAVKAKWVSEAMAANTEKTVATALWNLRQYINPAVITQKGAKEMAKWEPQLKALAS